MTTESNETNNIQPEVKSPVKTKEIIIKKELHPLHYSKYLGRESLFYGEADMMYCFNVSENKKGLLVDKEAVEKLISTWIPGDGIGVGYKVLVYKQYIKEDEEVEFYSDYKMSERSFTDLSEVISIPLSLINKYMDMKYIDILYRDGELYGLKKSETQIKFEVYEMPSSGDLKEEDKKEEEKE